MTESHKKWTQPSLLKYKRLKTRISKNSTHTWIRWVSIRITAREFSKWMSILMKVKRWQIGCSKQRWNKSGLKILKNLINISISWMSRGRIENSSTQAWINEWIWTPFSKTQTHSPLVPRRKSLESSWIHWIPSPTRIDCSLKINSTGSSQIGPNLNGSRRPVRLNEPNKRGWVNARNSWTLWIQSISTRKRKNNYWKISTPPSKMSTHSNEMRFVKSWTRPQTT